MSLEEKFAHLFGEPGRIGAAHTSPWRRDWLDNFGEIPRGIAQPVSNVKVSKVIKLCAAASVPVIRHSPSGLPFDVMIA